MEWCIKYKKLLGVHVFKILETGMNFIFMLGQTATIYSTTHLAFSLGSYFFFTFSALLKWCKIFQNYVHVSCM